MKNDLFMIRNLLLVILVGFCMNSFAADYPKDDLWKLAQKLLDERIRQNTLLIEQGRQDEANYVIDMHKLLLGESKRFIPATLESSLQRELGDVFLGGNKTDVTGRIQPYLIIMLPVFEGMEHLERGDELQPLKVDSSSYTLGLRSTHQASLIATLVITGYIRVTPDPPVGVYTPIAGATQTLNYRLGFDMFTRWASVPSAPRQQTTDAFVTEATTRFINILEGPPTPPSSPFEITCDVTIEQLTTRTQEIRESEYESTLTGFKGLLQDASKKVNGCDYLFADQDLSFVKDDVFSGQVIPDKLVTLASHSNFKMYVVFKEVNFAMSSTDWLTFAQSVYEGSSLAGSNSILLIVPYMMLDIGCSHTSRWLGKRVNDRTAMIQPVVYGADVNVKNAMNLAFGTATEWNAGFLDAFKRIPKDHIICSYYFRADGKALNVVSKSYNQTDNESIVELNFWYDKEAMEYLAHTVYNPNNTEDYTTTNPLAPRSVGTKENFEQEIARRLENPNPQMHPHNLKEQYIETYHQSYVHNYLHRTYPRYFTRGISAEQPLPEDALIEVPQDLVLVAIDAASLILAPWGLDAAAEVVGLMYSTYKGDVVNAALYASSLALVAVTPAIVRGFIRGADVAITAERKIAVELVEGAAQTAARTIRDNYDAAAKLLTLSPNDIDNVVDGMPPLNIEPVEIRTIRINGVDYEISATARFYTDGSVTKCYIDGGYCFAAGTSVLLADGSRANIEHIAKGQTILSYDHKAGASCENKVVSVVRRTANRISRLLLAGAALFVTPEHPLFANNEYIQVQNLHPGDSILTAEGDYKKVESVVTYDSAVTVYNLEVENAHNYFAGERALLVHNSCGWLTIKNAVAESSFRIFHNKVISAALTAPERKAFYEFLATQPDQTLFNRIVSHEISPGAWAAVHRAERHALKTDPEILAKVTKVLEHGNLARYIPIQTGTRNITTRIELLEQIIRLQDEAGTLSRARMSPLADLMDNLDHFLITHASKPGAVDFMRELTESARKMVGGSFILHVLKNNPDKIGTVIRFEATVATQVDEIGDVVVDIISTKGTVTNIFNEFKNWGGMSPNLQESFIRQFAAYLTSKDLGGFYYFFKKDAQGFSTIADLRSSVATAMKNHKTMLQNLPLEKLQLFGEIQNQVLRDTNIDHFLNNNFAKIFDLVE